MVDLQEIEAIKQLKYRYMRCLDRKLWAELEQCFTEAATCAYGGGKYAFQGRRAILQFLVDAMGRDSFLSSHRVHHPEIRLTSATSASGIWALEDTVIDLQREVTIQGAAFYRDEYAKQAGEWRICHTGYERTFEQVQSRAAEPRWTLTENCWARR